MHAASEQTTGDLQSHSDRAPREYFLWLMREASRVLLRIDRPYVALCLRQFETMALAVWPADPPAR
jgi:hypothetical protein